MVTDSNCTMVAEGHTNTDFNVMSFVLIGLIPEVAKRTGLYGKDFLCFLHYA